MVRKTKSKTRPGKQSQKAKRSTKSRRRSSDNYVFLGKVKTLV